MKNRNPLLTIYWGIPWLKTIKTRVLFPILSTGSRLMLPGIAWICLQMGWNHIKLRLKLYIFRDFMMIGKKRPPAHGSLKNHPKILDKNVVVKNVVLNKGWSFIDTTKNLFETQLVISKLNEILGTWTHHNLFRHEILNYINFWLLKVKLYFLQKSYNRRNTFNPNTCRSSSRIISAFSCFHS